MSGADKADAEAELRAEVVDRVREERDRDRVPRGVRAPEPRQVQGDDATLLSDARQVLQPVLPAPAEAVDEDDRHGVLVLGAELGPKADPTTTTYVPRPEWYFFFLFELLRIIKPPTLTPLATIGIPMNKRLGEHGYPPHERAALLAASAAMGESGSTAPTSRGRSAARYRPAASACTTRTPCTSPPSPASARR